MAGLGGGTGGPNADTGISDTGISDTGISDAGVGFRDNIHGGVLGPDGRVVSHTPDNQRSIVGQFRHRRRADTDRRPCCPPGRPAPPPRGLGHVI